MDVRLPKIETPYVDDETSSLPVADFRESAYPAGASPPPVLIKHASAHPLADVMTSHSGIPRIYERVSETALFSLSGANEIYTFG